MSNLPHPFPPAEVLSPREAQDLGAPLDAAISTGSVHETPRVDGIASRLRLAAQPPSQAQRNAARQATPAAAPTDTSSNRQAQPRVVASVRASTL